MEIQYRSEKAFDKILKVAIDNHIDQEEMPEALVVISDMEIDQCTNDSWTFYDQMADEFKNMVMRFLTLCSGMFKVEIMFFMLTATEKVFSYVLGSQHQHFKMSFPQLVLRQ